MMWWTAIILGVAGSLHCAGMCGPLALAMRSSATAGWPFYSHRLIYNLGRVFTYSMLGVLAGSIGAVVALAGLQQALSILLGVVLLLSAMSAIPVMSRNLLFFLQPLSHKLTGRMAQWLQVKSGLGMFWIGLLNGLLPCGLVYTALAGAVVTASVAGGGLYMILFGLGTIPLMLLISLSGRLLPLRWRSSVIRLFPYITAAVAILLILRGMNLGIPMLSPEMHTGEAECGLCSK